MFAGFDDLEDGQPVPFAVCHGEPGRGDGLRGFAVEMTTAGEACPKRIEKIGGLARQGRMAAHVFEQEQAALRLEHATQFTQAAQGFRHTAKEQGANDAVERGVGKGQALNIALRQAKTGAGLRCRHAHHVPAFVHANQAGVGRIMGKVDTGAHASTVPCKP